jgi:DNA-binding helix-turn-helix protein
MNNSELIKMMVNNSNKSYREVSLELGKTQGYVSALISQNSSPNLATFIKIAEACNCIVNLSGDFGQIELTELFND